MVPGRGRLLDRPEPADHDAVPDPRRRRPREPRVRLSRSWADDDRGDEAAGGLHVAADGDGADARGRWQAVRRRHPTTGVADDSGRSPGGDGERRSADRGRAADHRRTRRLPPLAPETDPAAPGGPAGRRRARSDRHRSGDRHRADRAQPGLDRRPEARHPDEVRAGAVRLPAGGLHGAQASPQRSAAACRRSWRGWRPRGGSTSSWRRGWARRTRPTRSRCPSPATSRRRWGWRCWTSRT